MTVYELTRDQISELKAAYFWNDDPDIQENLEAAGIFYYEDIPDDVIFCEYSGIYFVPDDFSCSADIPLF